MKSELLLLREVSTFDYDHKESQLDANKPMVLKGILQRCDTLNQNGRIYPKHILMRELENYMKLVKENRAFGETDHCDSPIVNMKEVSHMITDIWVDGDVVKGTVQLFDTPNGEIIKAIVRGGGKPGISSRAVGSLRKENGVDMVQDDLQIICWDFVSEPSTPLAFMTLAESLKRPITKEELRQLTPKTENVSKRVDELLSLFKRT